jgi:aladin
MVFAPIPFQPEALLPSREPAAPTADQAEPAETAPAPGLAATISEFFRRMVFPPLDVSWIVISESLTLNVNFLMSK